MNFYTSDLHFGQKSLLATGKWKERPFETLEEMAEELIKRHNAKVTNADHVYIIGDVGSRGYSNMHPEFLAQMKGSKHLILGNHDDVSDLRVRQQFVEVCEYKQLRDGDKKLFLSHYPVMMWPGQHKGTIMLYGHLHNTVEEQLYQKYLAEFNKDKAPNINRGETECRAFSVCSCLWDYEPVTLEEILNRKCDFQPKVR